MGGLLGLQQCTFDVGNESLVFLLCSETELRHPEHSRPQKTNQRKKGGIKERERVSTFQSQGEGRQSPSSLFLGYQGM